MLNSAFSENSSHTPHGYVEIDQSIYKVSPYSGPMFVKISGMGDIPAGVEHDRATIIITLPDGTKDNHRIFSTEDGTFQLLFPISYNSQVGTYKVFVTFAGSVLGDLTFNIARESGYTPQDETLYKLGSDITLFEIDSESYTLGSDIKLTGILESKYLDSAVTVKLIAPNGNLVHIHQLTPDNDGTFSAKIPAHGPTWKQEGQYTIEVNTDAGIQKAQFDFILPKTIPEPSIPIQTTQQPQPVTKTLSVLTLQEPSQGDYRYGSTSVISIPINGYLISDGKPIVGATINFNVNDSTNPNLSVKTGSGGFFQTYFESAALNESYRLQATYDGTTSSLPTVSEIKYFTVSKTVPSSPLPPTQSTQSDDWTGPIVGIILALIVVGIIAVVAKNRTKNKFKINQYIQSGGSSTPPPPPRPSGATESFHYACPNCSAKLQPPTSFDAGQKCLSCGWKS